MLFTHTAELEAVNENAAFVALAWQELFDPTTPNSFLPRLYDSLGLVEELAFLAELALQDERWVHHIKLVQAELKWVAGAEKIWLVNNSWSKGVIENICCASDVAQIQDLAVLFVDTSPNHVTQLCECLHRELTTLPKNKKNSLAVLRLLGTQAIRRGLTSSDVTLNLSEMNLENQTEIADHLQELIEVDIRPFHCVVHLRGDSSNIHSLFSSNGFQKVKKQDFPLDDTGQKFKNSISLETAFRYETEAVSHIDAASRTVKACRRIIDMFNLYQNRAGIELDAEILVADGRRTEIVSRHIEQSLATQPSRSVKQLTRKALDNIQFENLDSGLENSLEQHSLALSSTEQKASLVGIWTAFECLVGSDKRASNVKRIVDWIAPIITLRRVEKITRYLAVCCHEYYKSKIRHPSQPFTRSSFYYFSPRDILDAVTGHKENDLVVPLLQDISDHPLLRYRICNAWQRFHNSKTVKRDLVASRQNLSWHLERIYRARNLTVHQGMTPPFVSELVDHAQHYFTRCMTRVLADLREHSSWTVRTALEHQKQRFEFVIAKLATEPRDIPARYFFPSDDDFSDCFPWLSEG